MFLWFRFITLIHITILCIQIECQPYSHGYNSISRDRVDAQGLHDSNERQDLAGKYYLAKYERLWCNLRNRLIVNISYVHQLLLQGDRENRGLTIISAIKVRKLLKKGCAGYLASLVGDEEQKPKDILVMCEYLDVFSDNLPGQPPERKVQYGIDLLPGTAPISKAPY